MSTDQFQQNMFKLFDGRRERVRRLTGTDLKRSGQESVYSHTPDWYKEAFKKAVERLSSGTRFTIEDIRSSIGDPPESVSVNCMGSLMNMVAKKKLIKKTGLHVPAKRESRNANEIAEWVRL